MARDQDDAIATALELAFTRDYGQEASNVVDELSSIARALRDLGNGNAMTEMGAIEAHGKTVGEGLSKLADAGESIAAALDRIAAAIEGLTARGER